MDSQEIQLPHHHQVVMDRFVSACRADERVVAAFLGGSYARGAADAYSDLDLYLITTDDAYEDFVAGRDAFMQRLGELEFLEDFDLPNILFYIFADGVEGELGFGRESQFDHIHAGPYKVLLDKKNILAHKVFPRHEPDRVKQIETLRRLIFGFWHDLSHFITALGREQLWWAYGQLEALRRYGVNLARLRHNFADADVGEESYFKVEQVLPVEQLSSLRVTLCPMERDPLLDAAMVILRFYQELAPPLAYAHGITYPINLERVMVERLEQLRAAHLS